MKSIWSLARPRREVWDVFDRIQKEMFQNALENGGSTISTYNPPVNVSHSEEGVIVEAFVPGYDSNSIEITAIDNHLILSGKKRENKLPQGYEVYYEEVPNGEFKRSLSFSFALDSEKIEANFKNGVLTVKLPKAEKEKPKKITVQAL